MKNQNIKYEDAIIVPFELQMDNCKTIGNASYDKLIKNMETLRNDHT